MVPQGTAGIVACAFWSGANVPALVKLSYAILQLIVTWHRLAQLSHLVICIARNVVLVLDIQHHVECVQLFLRNAVLIGAQ